MTTQSLPASVRRFVLLCCLAMAAALTACHCPPTKLRTTKSDQQLIATVDTWFADTRTQEERVTALMQRWKEEAFLGPIAGNTDGTVLYLPVYKHECDVLFAMHSDMEGLLLMFDAGGERRAWYRVDRVAIPWDGTRGNWHPVYSADGQEIVGPGELFRYQLNWHTSGESSD